MAATFDLPALLEDKKTKLQLCDSEIRIQLDGSTITMAFSDIKSLQVKNAEYFLLKIKGDSTTVILQFSTIGPRDLAKAIIMEAMAPYEAIKKAALDKNLEAKALHNSLKRSTFKNIANCAMLDAEQSSDLYIQRPAADIFSKDFLNALTQPIVDTFIEMNCSLNQFYNLFITTYFYDIKNPKGSLDRLLAEKIRGSARRDGETQTSTTTMDYATRINSYSLMALTTATKVPEDIKPAKKKEIEFPPVIPFEITKQEDEPVHPGSNLDPFKIVELSCDFEPEIIGARPIFQYDPKDFELARDICKVVYHQRENTAVIDEAMEFSTNFKEMILGQYGEESVKYVERLVPSFYNTPKQENIN